MLDHARIAGERELDLDPAAMRGEVGGGM